MARSITGAVLIALGLLLPAVSQSTSSAAAPQDSPNLQQKANGPAATRPDQLTESGRLEFIRRAQVWTPTDVPSMNLREGPGGPGRFQPNELVTCDYRDEPKQGTSPKFSCVLAGGDVAKVRSGTHNSEG